MTTSSIRSSLSGSVYTGSNAVLTQTSVLTAASDDPTNTSGLGAPAIILGTVYAHKANGVTLGAGQTTLVRAATLAGLQAAVNYALSAGKFFVIEPGIYEIDGAAGLVIPTTANSFTWRGSKASQINQFHSNAPILSVGGFTGGSTVGAGLDIEGVSLAYGVSQTGNANAVALLMGYIQFSQFKQILASWVESGSGPTNPAYIGWRMTDAGSFQNIFRDITVGGGQVSLFSLESGGTGDVYEDIYLHNGSGASSATAVSGPAVNINPTSQLTNNTFTRMNIEWVTAYTCIFAQNTLATTWIGLHVEGFTPGAGYGAGFISAPSAKLKFISSEFLDCPNPDAGGGPNGFISVGYQSSVSMDGVYIKWQNASEVTSALVLVSPFTADDNSTVSFSDILIVDNGGNNIANFKLDSTITTVFGNNTLIPSYVADRLLPSTNGMQLQVSASYTHYGYHQNAVLGVPATLSGAITIGLSNKKKPSGTGSSIATPTGAFVRIRRQTGTYANTLTVTDIAGSTTLSTNTTAGVDLLYVFNGTNWVVAT